MKNVIVAHYKVKHKFSIINNIVMLNSVIAISNPCINIAKSKYYT